MIATDTCNRHTLSNGDQCSPLRSSLFIYDLNKAGIVPVMEAVCITPCLIGRGGRIMLEAIIKAHILAAAIAVAPNMLILRAGGEVKNAQNE